MVTSVISANYFISSSLRSQAVLSMAILGWNIILLHFQLSVKLVLIYWIGDLMLQQFLFIYFSLFCALTLKAMKHNEVSVIVK